MAGELIVHCIFAIMIGTGAFMVVVSTRNQQHEMTEVLIVTWRRANRKRFGQNLSAIIDVESICQLQSGPRRNERIQIKNGTALFPDKGMHEVVAVGRPTNHLAS